MVNKLKICCYSIILFLFTSCSKEKVIDDIDYQLYQMSIKSSGFTWFKNSNSLIFKSNGSGHSQPFLKTRYNSFAKSVLNTNGTIVPGSKFPEGSLIVKELFKDSIEITRYAVLFKKSADPNADSNGWIWGYVNSDASVAVSATNKGISCINCHSQSGNIDYMLMNKYFP